MKNINCNTKKTVHSPGSLLARLLALRQKDLIPYDVLHGFTR